jgi:hypothetical protein
MSMIKRVKRAATSAGTELDKRVSQAVEKNRGPLKMLAKMVVLPVPLPDQLKHRTTLGATGVLVGSAGAFAIGVTGIGLPLAALAAATMGWYAGAKLDGPGRASVAPPQTETSEARKDAAE